MDTSSRGIFKKGNGIDIDIFEEEKGTGLMNKREYNRQMKMYKRYFAKSSASYNPDNINSLIDFYCDWALFSNCQDFCNRYNPYDMLSPKTQKGIEEIVSYNYLKYVAVAGGLENLLSEKERIDENNTIKTSFIFECVISIFNKLRLGLDDNIEGSDYTVFYRFKSAAKNNAKSVLKSMEQIHPYCQFDCFPYWEIFVLLILSLGSKSLKKLVLLVEEHSGRMGDYQTIRGYADEEISFVDVLRKSLKKRYIKESRQDYVYEMINSMTLVLDFYADTIRCIMGKKVFKEMEKNYSSDNQVMDKYWKSYKENNCRKIGKIFILDAFIHHQAIMSEKARCNLILDMYDYCAYYEEESTNDKVLGGLKHLFDECYALFEKVFKLDNDEEVKDIIRKFSSKNKYKNIELIWQMYMGENIRDINATFFFKGFNNQFKYRNALIMMIILLALNREENNCIYDFAKYFASISTWCQIEHMYDIRGTRKNTEKIDGIWKEFVIRRQFIALYLLIFQYMYIKVFCEGDNTSLVLPEGNNVQGKEKFICCLDKKDKITASYIQLWKLVNDSKNETIYQHINSSLCRSKPRLHKNT